MQRDRFWKWAAALAASFSTLALGGSYGAEYRPSAREYRSERVIVQGSNAHAIGKECDAILARLDARYGKPAYWRAFPVYYRPGRGGAVAGYTSYVDPNVAEVVIYQDFTESVGKVLDHELTHAFFFYYLRSNFDLLLNEGLAQNSEYGSRERLRRQTYQRCAEGGFAPLSSLYGLNRYDAGLLIYTQGFSVVDFLIARGGSRWFSWFMLDLTHGSGNIDEALRRFYGYGSLSALEREWLEYVRTGQDASAVRAVGSLLEKGDHCE